MTKRLSWIGVALLVPLLWCSVAVGAPSLIGPGSAVAGQTVRYRVFVDFFATYRLEWSGFADGSTPVTECTYPIVGCYVDKIVTRSERVGVTYTRTDLAEGAAGRTGVLPPVFTEVFSSIDELPGKGVRIVGKKKVAAPGLITVLSPRRRVVLEWQSATGPQSGEAQLLGRRKVAEGFEHRFRLLAKAGSVILTARSISPLRESEDAVEAQRTVGHYRGPRYRYFKTVFDPGEYPGIAEPRLGLQFVATRAVRVRGTGRLQRLDGTTWKTVQTMTSSGRRPAGRRWLQQVEAFDRELDRSAVCTGEWRLVGRFRVTTPAGRNVLPRRLRGPVVRTLSTDDRQCGREPGR